MKLYVKANNSCDCCFLIIDHESGVHKGRVKADTRTGEFYLEEASGDTAERFLSIDDVIHTMDQRAHAYRKVRE